MIAPSVLSIAGSDSGGNAGLQADLRAFHVFGCHGCTVVAAVTAQNPDGVTAAKPMPVSLVEAQLDAVLGPYAPRAAKTGMLGSAALVTAVAWRLAARREMPAVVDPVMVATSGARLLPESALRAVRSRLLPVAALVTPNLAEAAALTGDSAPIRTVDRMIAAARRIREVAGCAVLVKGGHLEGAVAADVLLWGEAAYLYEAPAVENPASTHGTGCSLSAAIAASLALGRSMPDAVREAKAYVHEAIRLSGAVGPKAAVLGTPRLAGLRRNSAIRVRRLLPADG